MAEVPQLCQFLAARPQLFYKGKEPPKLPHLPKRKTEGEIAFGSSKKEAHILAKFRRLLGRMNKANRQLLLFMASWITKRQVLLFRLCF